ncbi:MAG: hypothetical protein AAB867_00185, partial [Patescibacteria group bacterium]
GLGVATSTLFSKATTTFESGLRTSYIQATSTLTVDAGTIAYALTATSTIRPFNNSFSFATSTTAIPILSLDGVLGRVGIGTTTPGTGLAVASTTLLAGTTTIYGLLSADVIQSTTTATSTFGGGITATRLSTTASSTLAGLRATSGGVRIDTLTNCSNGLISDTDGAVVCNPVAPGTGPTANLSGWNDNGVRVNLQTANDLVEIGTSATTTIGAQLSVTSTTTASKLFALKGVANQTGDYFRILDSSDNVLTFINAAGSLAISASSTPGVSLVATSTLLRGTTTIYGLLSADVIQATSSATSTFGGGILFTRASSTTATSTLAGLRITQGGLQLNSILNCTGGSTLDTDLNGNIICGEDAT